MAGVKRSIWVFADWTEKGIPELMGILQSELLRGKEIFSFEYDAHWLAGPQAQILDPDLQFYSGKQFLNNNSKSNFGMFMDSSSDRWGRVLMKRREAAQARAEERTEKNLLETDYLLGVFDSHRMGGLRFKTNPEGPFLSSNLGLASPPWTSIRELEQISLRLEENNFSGDPEYLNCLNKLVAAGCSLGGARPKASVLDNNNELWIAKFPSKHDDSDIGVWEWLVYMLAQKAGIQMADGVAQRFSSHHHTFLTKRFDRLPDGKRLHFASAMTLLGYVDGQDYLDGVSYLELAEFITSHSTAIQQDLEQLWRRIVFHICVSNVDDHLRNHGFILTAGGWRLSPAYDINPVETGIGLKLNISENDNALDLKLAMEVIPYFRLKKEKAASILKEVQHAVKEWKNIALSLRIPHQQLESKSRAFRHAYTQL